MNDTPVRFGLWWLIFLLLPPFGLLAAVIAAVFTPPILHVFLYGLVVTGALVVAGWLTRHHARQLRQGRWCLLRVLGLGAACLGYLLIQAVLAMALLFIAYLVVLLALALYVGQSMGGSL